MVKQFLLHLLLMVCSSLLLADRPVLAAEEVYVSFSILERSIPVSSLELYAREGKIDDNLAAYTRHLKPEELQQLREVLLQSIDVTPVAISQVLYSFQGELILERLGQVIQTQSGRSGFFAIRAALILAASEPEGLTLLNVLRKYPTQGIRIDLKAATKIALQWQSLVKEAQNAKAVAIAQAVAEASTEAVRDLDESVVVAGGPLSWKQETIVINDASRQKRDRSTCDRTYPVDVYLPEPFEHPAPTIVISHGLGSNRQTYQYLAEHLASHGFAVAVVEHLGSNAAQTEALLRGRVEEIAEPIEFINRPLDVRFLLDELTRLNKEDALFGGQLNLEKVGVIGQSFGGYTALTLAGAPINFEQLNSGCQPNGNQWNVSLLLQCRAVELTQVTLETQDPRIQAAIAINPIGSRLLGETSLSQIQVPVMIVAGSADKIAPAFPEQLQPFTWLRNAPSKYLVLKDGGTHFSTLQSTEDDVSLPSEVIGPDPELARRYIKGLSLAFFQTYVAGRQNYHPYLNPSSARALSQSPMPLYLLRSLTPEQLPPLPSGF